MSDDFSNHPVSISEARSDRSQSSRDWTPRDALIDLLRKIDRGEETPAVLVIVWREASGTVGFSAASPSIALSVGTIELAKHAMIESSACPVPEAV